MKRAIHCLVGALTMAAVCGQPAYFRDEEVSVVGEIQYGQTSGKIEYTGKPIYRAFWFDGHAGDSVDIKITSINGQAMASLTDSSYKPLVSNFGSHVVTVLQSSADPYPNRYFIVFAEERRRPATFTVTLLKTSADSKTATTDYLTCADDSECVAVPRAGCCNNGIKDAVNKDRIAAYREAKKCTNRNVICPQFIVDDQRPAKCNRSSHQCEMTGQLGTSPAQE